MGALSRPDSSSGRRWLEQTCRMAGSWGTVDWLVLCAGENGFVRRSGWFVYSSGGATTLRRATPVARAGSWLRTGGFRQADLNAAGWAAVLAPGAAVGLVFAIGFDQPLIVGVVAGATFSWLIALSVDRWRWLRSDCGYDISDLSTEATEDLTTRLADHGIGCRLAVETFEASQQSRILYAQMRSRRQVEACIAVAGASSP